MSVIGGIPFGQHSDSEMARNPNALSTLKLFSLFVLYNTTGYTVCLRKKTCEKHGGWYGIPLSGTLRPDCASVNSGDFRQ